MVQTGTLRHSAASRTSGSADVRSIRRSHIQTVAVEPIDWPTGWQQEAQEALTPFFGADTRIRILVDDPATAIDGTVLEGFVYLDETVPTIIHDRSGHSGVYPWKVLRGPVLRIYELIPRRRPRVLFAHPNWTPRHGD